MDADAHGVTVTVHDTGTGLSQQQIDDLSEPMRRGDDTVTTGSGLGLAIVNEVLAAHGSRLEPAVAGTGVAFTIPRLPT